jgi:hypothetical protein
MINFFLDYKKQLAMPSPFLALKEKEALYWESTSLDVNNLD